jgi:phage protein D
MSSNAPTYKILLGGKLLSTTELSSVSGIKLIESITNTAKLTIGIVDHIDFVITSDRVKLGTEIEVRMGYGQELESMFVGEIVEVKPVFPLSGVPAIELTALDRSYLLKKKPLPFIFEASKFPNFGAIANYIAKKHRLEFLTGSSDKAISYTLSDDSAIEQTNETDWEIMTQLSRTGNYKLFVRGSILYMVDNDWLLSHQQYRYIFEYRPSTIDTDLGLVIPLKSFEPKLGAKGQREKVQVISWKAAGSSNKDEVEASNPPTEGNRGYTDIKVQSSTIETIRVPVIVTSKAQAKAAAESELQRRAESLVKGSGAVQGMAGLRIGHLHTFRLNGFSDLGRDYSGNYHITEVTHTYDNKIGYVTKFEVRRMGLSK